MVRSILTLARVLALVGVVSLFISGCRQSARPTGSDEGRDVVIELVMPDAPPVMGETTLRVRLASRDGAPVTGATVEVRGDMAHAGMVPVIGAAEPTEVAGEYAAAFEWTMAGDWIVTVTATLPDGAVVSEEFQVVVSTT